MAGWITLALLALYAGLVTVGWVRSRSGQSSLLSSLLESEAVAEGYKQAALFNKQAAEELETAVVELQWEVTLLRSAVFTVGTGWDGDEVGSLDVRA